MVTVLEPDDGQGWIKVRTRLADGSLEGLIPAGYVEVQPTPAPPGPSQPQTQQPQRNGTPSSLATGYTTPPGPSSGPAPSYAPGGYPSGSSHVQQGPGGAPAQGFPFSTPRIPGGFVSSPHTPQAPSTPIEPRPSGPPRGMYGQGESFASSSHSTSLEPIDPDRPLNLPISDRAVRLPSGRIG